MILKTGKGVILAKYVLDKIEMQKYDGSQWQTVSFADDATTPATSSNQRLYGSWAPMPPMGTASNNAATAQTKLWLWSKTPYNHTIHGGAMFDEFSGLPADYPCPPTIDSMRICCDFDHDPVGTNMSPEYLAVESTIDEAIRFIGDLAISDLLDSDGDGKPGPYDTGTNPGISGGTSIYQQGLSNCNEVRFDRTPYRVYIWFDIDTASPNWECDILWSDGSSTQRFPMSLVQGTMNCYEIAHSGVLEISEITNISPGAAVDFRIVKLCADYGNDNNGPNGATTITNHMVDTTLNCGL